MNITPDVVFLLIGDYLSDRWHTLAPEHRDYVAGKLRNRDIKALATCSKLGLPQLLHRESWVTLRQIEALIKKCTVFTSKTADEAALTTLFEGEEACRLTNERLSILYATPELNPEKYWALERMRVDIDRMLGCFSHFLENIPGKVKLTSGATFSTSRRQSQPHKKLRLKWEGPLTAKPYIEALARYFGHETKLRWKTVSTNRLVLVLKNWETKRTIACEPGGALPLQLAFDGYAKDRLLSWGVDLSSQSRNQRLAHLGSVTGQIATLDLKNASNSVSRSLCAWLLPDTYYDFLNGIRSVNGVLPNGKTVVYEMFSSMGNGATFVLETMIFAAACRAVGSKVYSVYGDDIAIETEKAEELIDLLSYLGFAVNLQKSFRDGPYRESCGEHYWNGERITPFYLREVPLPKPGQKDISNWGKAMWCHNVNGLVKVSPYEGRVWERCRQIVDYYRLPLVPFSEDTLSGVFITAFEAYRLRLLRSRRTGKDRRGPFLMVRGFHARAQTRILATSRRCLLLWHLRSFWGDWGKDDHIGVADPKEQELLSDRSSSQAPTGSVKYVRSWLNWYPPVVATPSHLYSWEDYLNPQK